MLGRGGSVGVGFRWRRGRLGLWGCLGGLSPGRRLSLVSVGIAFRKRVRG